MQTSLKDSRRFGSVVDQPLEARVIHARERRLNGVALVGW
jgi:hypothetical protein